MLLFAHLILACDKDPEPQARASARFALGALSLGETAPFPGLVGVPNVDDDDEDGVADRDHALRGAEDDLASLELNIGDQAVALTLSGAVEAVRVYEGEALLLGGPGGPTTASLAAGERALALRVEFLDYNSRAELRATEAGGGALSLPLTSAPLILNHHLQPASDFWALSVGSGNAAFIESFEQALGEAFHVLDARTYQRDVWVQDEVEFATLTGPESSIDFVIDTIRNGRGLAGSGLDDFPENELFGPDVGIGTWGRPAAQSYDYGGNIEVSPPVTVNGVFYPFGRIYYGANGDAAPNQDLRDFFDAQRIQAPFTVPTDWLFVGHIDEFVSIIPDSSARYGFRLVLTDTELAWQILEAMDPTTPLARWSLPAGSYQGHNIDNVGEILEDDALRALNEDVQRDHIDPARDILLAELGLGEEDILRVPGLFEEVRAGQVVALIPGLANMAVVQLEDQPVRLFLPDPFMRTDEEDLDADPLIGHIRATFPEGVELHFVDDWAWYHMGYGEVHCGTNTLREPMGDWWSVGLHLLEVE